MNSLNVSSAEAYAVPATALENVAPVRTFSKYAEGLFLSVVAPHLADAIALARWLTGSGADAQDIVQEASLRALRGIDKFANGNARAWVLTIVRHTAYDWLHKNRPAALVFVDDLEDVEGAHFAERDATTPETALMEIEEATLLNTAILALPAHHREMLLLRDVQGLTYRDIAKLSGISIGTMMSRLFRARRQLIALMTQNAVRGKCGVGIKPKLGINPDYGQSRPMTVHAGDSIAVCEPQHWRPRARLRAGSTYPVVHSGP